MQFVYCRNLNNVKISSEIWQQRKEKHGNSIGIEEIKQKNEGQI